jgi:excisionase family DNA binding protein
MEEILTITEAAEYLKVSTRTLARLIRDKRVPAKKVGRQWRFSRVALESYINPTKKAS